MTDIPYVQFEAKKDGLAQSQDGLWSMKLKVAQDQMPAEFLSAPMGQRLTVIVVALRGDGEDAKPGEIFGETGYTKGSSPKDKTAPKSVEGQLVQSSVMLCKNAAFKDWAEHQCRRGAYAWPSVQIGDTFTDAGWCRAFILTACGIPSRRELAVDPVARELFLDLREQFKHRDTVGR